MLRIRILSYIVVHLELASNTGMSMSESQIERKKQLQMTTDQKLMPETRKNILYSLFVLL
jgi:hypothetical protein